jgi:chorismate synthase
LLKNFRFLTSGESHGKCLTGIIEGVPAGFDIDENSINEELKKRQSGIGRGKRMQIEFDKVEIKSGIRFGKTTAAPICLEIKNKDYENWEKILSTKKEDINFEKAFSEPRPGHADFAGKFKYNFDDLRNILERASARKTAMNVAIGSIAKQILKQFGIISNVEILSVCGKKDYEDEIIKARKEGDSLGGNFKVTFKNVPIGLGSYVQWDRKIDGIIAQAVMSIPAVKSVEIGLGKEYEKYLGSEVHDEIFYDGEYKRKSNNAGGIEGGMTNGEDIIVKATMKPIPTIKKALKTINFKDNSSTEAHFERSDTCAIEACAVIADNMIACVILDEFLEKFGKDNLMEIKEHYGK